MRILVCGSRNWKNYLQIVLALRACEEAFGTFTLIHGACRGADQIAARISVELGMVTIAVPPRWEQEGLKAGPLRNTRMLKQGRPGVILAFHDDPAFGRGTADMIRKGQQAGVPVIVVRSDTPMSQLEEQLSKIER